MLIVGAKGFAKEVLEIFHQKNRDENICFYDDINSDIPSKLYNQYPILKSEKEAENYFRLVSPEFVIGIGNPKLRKMMYDKFIKLGGKPSTIISENAEIGSFGIEIDDACIIMAGAKISNGVKIKRGTMVYYNSVITHDVTIGEFCEISPTVNILGGVNIGDLCHIATASVLLPKINIGNNVIIAAGSVVRSDVPSNTMVAGIPAVFKKNLL